MKVFFVIVTLAVLLWKGFYACQRGLHTYKRDRRDHDSLREYLLANGASETEALYPFLQHALVRTFQPLLLQWRLLLILLALALLTGLIADDVNIGQAMLMLLGLLVIVGVGLLLVIYFYVRYRG